MLQAPLVQKAICKAGGCTVEGCERQSWSAGLCQRHYQAELRRRHDAPEARQVQVNGGPNGCFDRRFVGLFLDELEQRDHPCYPSGPWFTALARADAEFIHLGPLKPAILRASGSPETAGVAERGPRELGHGYGYGARAEEDISAEVGSACDRWLYRRNLIQRGGISLEVDS